MLVDDWTGLVRVVVLGTSAYLALVAILRISGKRTLAKMNAFDLVVTVALGSTLATILLTEDVALLEGVLGLLTLVMLQYVIALLAVRYPALESLFKASPRRLVAGGTVDESALRDERVTREEVLAAVRGAGFGDLAEIEAVVLETDGSFSVVSRDKAGSGSALPGVPREAR